MLIFEEGYLNQNSVGFIVAMEDSNIRTTRRAMLDLCYGHCVKTDSKSHTHNSQVSWIRDEDFLI